MMKFSPTNPAAILLVIILYPTILLALITPTEKNIPVKLPPRHLTKEISVIAYNDKLFDLAYKIYLANKNISSAFQLAQAAVKQRPNLLRWRHRLAQVAIWLNRQDIAIQQWFYLLKKQYDPKLLLKILSTFRNEQENQQLVHTLNVMLKKHPNRTKAWQALVTVDQEMGQPEEAINALLKAKNHLKPAYVFQTLTTLYLNTGKISLAKKLLLAEKKQQGQNIAISQQLAQLYILEGQLQQAYNELLPYQHRAKITNTHYWQQLGDSAWLLQQQSVAQHAYHQLVSTQEADVNRLNRLVNLTTAHQPKRAFALAKKSWSKQQNADTGIILMSLASTLKQWSYLTHFVQKIPVPIKQRMLNNPIYWVTQGQVWLALGQPQRALTFYQNAFQRFPDNIQLRADYLWLLLEKKDSILLQTALQKWRATLKHTPLLWEPYAAAYLYLRQPEKALTIFQWQLEKKHQDYPWLLDLAFILDEVKLPRLAYSVRKFAWQYLQPTLWLPQAAMDAKAQLAYLQLSSFGATADGVMQTYRFALANHPNQEFYDSALNYAIEQQHFALSRRLEQAEKRQKLHVPPNIQLATAIHQFDSSRITKVITQYQDVLANTETYGAINLIGEKNKAATIAFHALQKSPHDSALFKDAWPILLQRANSWLFVPSFEEHGSLEGPRIILNVSQYLTPRLRVTPFINRWRYRSSNAAIFARTPGKDNEAGMKLRYLNRRGYTELMVSYRDALAGFSTAYISNQYRWSQRLVSLVKLGINQRADETSGLRIAGIKNMLTALLTYELTARDSLEARVGHLRFFDQTHTYLGQGMEYEAAISHRFMQAYPTPSITFFSQVKRYHAQGIPSRRLLRLFPNGTIPETDLVMPDSFVQYGLLAQVGTQYIKGYSHDWKPFAEAAVFNDSNTGLGYSADIGLGTAIFGRDHLALILSYSRNTQGTELEDRYIGIRYQYYYS